MVLVAAAEDVNREEGYVEGVQIRPEQHSNCRVRNGQIRTDDEGFFLY